MTVFIVMGVSGCGKTTIGQLLAEKIGCSFFDADDFHSIENKSKMSKGIPLTDEDRKPWLNSLHENIEKWIISGNSVLACSALKKKYREHLSKGQESKVIFIYLKASKEEIKERLTKRKGHFMNSALLDSQFATLEEPDSSENTITVNGNASPSQIVSEIVNKIQT